MGLTNRKMMLERKQESQNWEETWREGHEFVILRKGTKLHDRAKIRNTG